MKRACFVCLLVLCSSAMTFAQNVLYFPHVVNGDAGGVWKTTIFLTNPASSGTASGSIILTRDNSGLPNLSQPGSPMNVTFVDENNQVVGSGSTIPFQIAGGHSRKFISTGTGGYSGGFARVESNAPVSGTAIFSYFGTGSQVIAEAGVPSASAVSRQAIFVDIGNGFDIGVAFSNPGQSAANVTLQVLNSSAQQILATTQVIGAGNHIGAYVNQFFPGQPLPGTLNGTMQITSDNGSLAAVALRFSPGNAFTTMSPFTLASVVAPAVRWLHDLPWSSSPVSSLARLIGSLQFRRG